MPTAKNVLLLSADQHNAEIAGFAGNPVVKTPNLDALAADGTVFDQAFTAFPICTPARTSVFTGMFASRHGVRHNVNMNYRPGKPGLAPECRVFPDFLRENGWTTALFGKLHTRHEGGRNFGLDRLFAVEGKGHFMPSPDEQDEYRRYLASRGYPPDIWKVWENDPGYAENGFVRSPLPESDYVDTFIADRAVEYLGTVREPFCAWVSFCSPHNPWDPPAPYDSLYDPAEIPMPHRREGELEKKPGKWVDQIARTIPALPATSMDPSLPGGAENAYLRYPEDKTRRMLAAYYGEISHIDAQVGKVLRCLRDRGLYENTLIIYLSDHGDYCGNNWAFYKYQGLYDALVRIPLVICAPGTTGGRRVDKLVSLVDIAPTILAAAGIEPPDDWDGASLGPLLEGKATEWRRELLVEDGTNALITAEWKYILWPDGTEELYDRRKDPHDLDNLGQAPEFAPIRQQMRPRLETQLRAMR